MGFCAFLFAWYPEAVLSLERRLYWLHLTSETIGRCSQFFTDMLVSDLPPLLCEYCY